MPFDRGVLRGTVRRRAEPLVDREEMEAVDRMTLGLMEDPDASVSDGRDSQLLAELTN
jgi:hypothetical protein